MDSNDRFSNFVGPKLKWEQLEGGMQIICPSMHLLFSLQLLFKTLQCQTTSTRPVFNFRVVTHCHFMIFPQIAESSSFLVGHHFICVLDFFWIVPFAYHQTGSNHCHGRCFPQIAQSSPFWVGHHFVWVLGLFWIIPFASHQKGSNHCHGMCFPQIA